jgi:hypothetical protein
MSIGNLAKTLLAHIARYDYTVRMRNPSSPVATLEQAQPADVAFQTLRQDLRGDLKDTQWIISPGVRGALT